MSKKSRIKKSGNSTVAEIYEAYCQEMQRTLGLVDSAPHKFANVEFVEYFQGRVERLDTLIALYADLVLAYRNWN